MFHPIEFQQVNNVMDGIVLDALNLFCPGNLRFEHCKGKNLEGRPLIVRQLSYFRVIIIPTS